jgi:hypothetical protein
LGIGRGVRTLDRVDSSSTQISESPSPDFSRTQSQSTIATIDGHTPHKMELVRSQSDVSYSFREDRPGTEMGVWGVRERKESSASSVASAKDNVRRMIPFLEASPEDIASALTKLEWEYFIALEVLPFLVGVC